MLGLALFVAALLICVCVVLPIVAIVRTRKIRILELRLSGVEAALLRVLERQPPKEAILIPPVTVPTEVAPTVREEPLVGQALPPADVSSRASQPVPATPSELASTPASPASPQHLETVIGQKWVGWVAIVLIFCAAGYFLKYAIENRWIGELGRVTLGVFTGLAFAWAGLERYRKGWRYLSQILTSGGITILYLSVYAAFGYYHLVEQRTAFAFLVVLVAEAHLLAMAYSAPAISVMALVGGFLTPILLSTGRDQYAVLFSYIGVLDLGVVGIVLAKRWRGIGSLAYAGTQLLFWGWYGEHYHPEKRAAVLVFQTAIFVLFLLADLAPHLRERTAGWEEWIRLAVNPFVFYATCYSLLNPDRHDWMAVLALLLGIVYAALARLELTLRPSDRRRLLVTVGTALTFATLAIPVQLESNWITIGWALEAVVLVWASMEAAAPALRWLSAAVFALATCRFLFEDTPWGYRAPFTPVLNRYFLATLALSACFGAAAWLYRREATGRHSRMLLTIGLLGVFVLWLGSSVEAYSYFGSQADPLDKNAALDAVRAAKQLRWAGQLSISVLWSAFAGLMTAAGFRSGERGWRIAGLVLFAVTLVKVVFVDISELEQFYRIVALLALGLVLLSVAWAYQRLVRREQVR